MKVDRYIKTNIYIKEKEQPTIIITYKINHNTGITHLKLWLNKKYRKDIETVNTINLLYYSATYGKGTNLLFERQLLTKLNTILKGKELRKRKTTSTMLKNEKILKTSPAPNFMLYKVEYIKDLSNEILGEYMKKGAKYDST